MGEYVTVSGTDQIWYDGGECRTVALRDLITLEPSTPTESLATAPPVRFSIAANGSASVRLVAANPRTSEQLTCDTAEGAKVASCTGSMAALVTNWASLDFTLEFCPPCSEEWHALAVTIDSESTVCDDVAAEAIKLVVYEAGVGHVDFRGTVGRWEEALLTSCAINDPPIECLPNGLCVVGDSVCKLGGITEFNFDDGRLIHSNLGGLGPDSGKPEEMRINGVAKTFDGRRVDLIVTVSSDYSAANVNQNEQKAGGLVSINIRSGTHADFVLSFVDGVTCPEDGSKAPCDVVELEQFELSIYDIDLFSGRGSAPGVTEKFRLAKGSFDSWSVTYDSDVRIGSELGTTTFRASKQGTIRDNPSDPSNLTPLQRRRTVSFLFSKKGRVLMHFHAEGTLRQSGRNFLIGGAALFLPCASPPPAPPPSPPNVVMSSIYLSFLYPANARSAAVASAECHHIQPLTVDKFTGEYAFTSRFPAPNLVDFVAADAVSDPSNAGAMLVYPSSKSPYTVFRHVNVTDLLALGEASETGTQRLQTLDTVYHPPAASDFDEAPRGEVLSADPAYIDALAVEGAVEVSLHPNLDAPPDAAPIATVLTTEGGAFEFAPSPEITPGMYTLRVQRNKLLVNNAPQSLTTAAVIVPQQFNVLWNAQNLTLRVVPVPADDGAVRALLSWSPAAWIGIDLFLSFRPPYGDHCDVWAGRDDCGGGVWNTSAGTASQLVVLDGATFDGPREYTLYARRADRRCHGYRLKSDPELNGGEEFVDCIGDCSDGTGYCYATEAADGELLCAPCLLWKSFPSEQEGEVSCFDFGTPQGGPLPGTKDWADEGSCNAAAWSEAVASFNSTEEGGVAVPPARCLNSPNAAWNTDGGAELRLITGGRVVATQRLHLDLDAPFTDFELRDGFHAARLGCLQAGAPGVVVPTHDVGLLSDQLFLKEVYIGSSSCSAATLGPWPCGLFDFACE